MAAACGITSPHYFPITSSAFCQSTWDLILVMRLLDLSLMISLVFCRKILPDIFLPTWLHGWASTRSYCLESTLRSEVVKLKMHASPCTVFFGMKCFL